LYQAAFSATYNSDISSFQFGIWPADDCVIDPSGNWIDLYQG
jgi:hypothetical protein